MVNIESKPPVPSQCIPPPLKSSHPISEIMQKNKPPTSLVSDEGIVKKHLTSLITLMSTRVSKLTDPAQLELKDQVLKKIQQTVYFLDNTDSPKELQRRVISYLADLLRPFPLATLQKLTRTSMKSPPSLKQVILDAIYDDAIHLYGQAYIMPDNLQMYDEPLMRLYQEQIHPMIDQHPTPFNSMDFIVEHMFKPFDPAPKIEAYAQVRVAGMGSTCWGSESEAPPFFKEFPSYLPLEWLIGKKEGETISVPFHGRILHLKLSHARCTGEGPFEKILKEWYVITEEFEEYLRTRLATSS